MILELDRVDRQLLALLQQDGRLTAQALSEQVHLSARATLNRIRRLERAGLVLGYRAVLDRAAVGAQVIVFAEIALKDQRRASVQRFERRMGTCSEVVGCWVISGRYDYLVRIACPDLDRYHQLINGWLDEPALGIEKIVTNIELQTIKEFIGFPLPA